MPPPLDLSTAQDAAATADPTPISDPTPTNTAPAQTDPVASAQPAAAPVSQPAAQPTAVGTPTAEQQWTLRQQLQQLGLNGQWADDKSAWQDVQAQWQRQAQEYQRAQEIAQYYLANKAKFDAALQPQQQPAAQPGQPQPATAKESWWKAPEWNTDYERFLTTDDKGRVVAVPGADPTLPMKYEQYRSWQKDTLTKFLQNPIETIKPGLEQMIEAKAQELIEKKLGAYDAKQFASNYVAGAADWMYQKGQDGRPAVDSLGKPILTTAGQKFAGYVTEAESLGIQDARQQQNYAERMTQRDAYAAWYAQAQGKQPAAPGQPAPQPAATPTPEQVNDELKRKAVAGKGANRLPASGGGTPPANNPNDHRPMDPRLGLGGRLSKALREAGVEAVN